MDFSKVLGGALWWLQRMATARLALLYDRILAGTLSSAAHPAMTQRQVQRLFLYRHGEIRYIQMPPLTAGELLELLLQGDGGVVGAKHLRRQAVHQLL